MLTAKPVYVDLLSVLKARLLFSGWSLWGHHGGLNLVLYQVYLGVVLKQGSWSSFSRGSDLLHGGGRWDQESVVLAGAPRE